MTTLYKVKCGDVGIIRRGSVCAERWEPLPTALVGSLVEVVETGRKFIATTDPSWQHYRSEFSSPQPELVARVISGSNYGAVYRVEGIIVKWLSPLEALAHIPDE